MNRTPRQRKVLDEARAIRRAENQARLKKIKADRIPEKKDRGRVRDNGHLAFIRRLPCACCGSPAPSDAAHIRTASAAHGKAFTGGQRKPDDKWTLPLSRACHERQHSGSELRFWEERGIDPFALAARLYEISGDIHLGQAAILNARPRRRHTSQDFIDMHRNGEKDIT